MVTLPKLGLLLKQIPSGHWMSSNTPLVENGYRYRDAEHVMRFDEVQVYSPTSGETKKRGVVVRVREEIRYPEDWWTRASLSQLVQRRATLINAYYKEE